MKCNHNDCFTCPYKDCISDVEVGTFARRGRKPLSAEEKAKRKKARHSAYYIKHQAKWHEIYMKKSEGKVKRRYKTRTVTEIEAGK